MPANKSLSQSFIPAFLWWLIVLVLMCTPGYDLPNLGKWTELISLDKLIHIIIFGLMAYLFMRPVSKRDFEPSVKKQFFFKIAIAISIWGLTTEYIQEFWVPGRSFDIWDWMADTIGALLAILFSRKYLNHLQD
jgi:VanZ family protein